jgi:hypothetical protein
MVILLWDFDGVLFYNPEKNYKTDFLLNAGVKRIARIPKGNNILFTGRSITQSEDVKRLLKTKNIDIDDFYFADFKSTDYALNNFMDIYYKWKVDTVVNIIMPKYPRHEIILLDDDIKVIEAFKNADIKIKLVFIKEWLPKYTKKIIYS